MVKYECNNCRMAVNASFAKRYQALVDYILRLVDGVEVQISRCPKC